MIVTKGSRIEITEAVDLAAGLSVTQSTDGVTQLGLTTTPNRADTSGATLAQLEAEVNALKAVLRNLGVYV